MHYVKLQLLHRRLLNLARSRLGLVLMQDPSRQPPCQVPGIRKKGSNIFAGYVGTSMQVKPIFAGGHAGVGNYCNMEVTKGDYVRDVLNNLAKRAVSVTGKTLQVAETGETVSITMIRVQ